MVWDASELVGGRRNRRHNLNMVDGKASMFYTGEVPWHQLGTKLDRPATSAEAMEAANLSFKVATVGLRCDALHDDEGREIAGVEGLLVPQGQAVVRLDTLEVLGNVGPGWKPIQNHQAFNFLDCVAAENRIEYHTAGALGKGERVWMLAKLPGLMQVGRTDDTVDKYLLLSNAHDGSSALWCLWTPIRVVCQNTLAVALAGAEGQGIKIRHSGDIETKVAEAQRVLGLAERFYDEELKPRIDRLVSLSPTQKQLDGYFKALYPDPENPEESKRAAATATQVRGVLADLFENGVGHDMPGVHGSLWAAYNSVTEYIDHDRPIRGAEKFSSHVGASKKLQSIWWGDGAKIKREAWSLACELAECV